MIEFAREGGRFTEEAIRLWATLNGGRPDPPLIAISQFPDGMEMIHDGHNRVVCKCLAGCQEIHDSEYFVAKFSYEDYEILEPRNNWFTPFDVRTHVRKADFMDYKTQARKIYLERPEDLAEFVRKNRDQYCAVRDLYTVAELAAIVRRRL